MDIRRNPSESEAIFNSTPQNHIDINGLRGRFRRPPEIHRPGADFRPKIGLKMMITP